MEKETNREPEEKNYTKKDTKNLKKRKLSQKGRKAIIISFFTFVTICGSIGGIQLGHNTQFNGKTRDVNEVLVIKDANGETLVLAPCGDKYAELYAQNHRHYTLKNTSELGKDAVPGIYEIYGTKSIIHPFENQKTIVTETGKSINEYMNASEKTKAELNSNKINSKDLKVIRDRLIEEQPKVKEKTK